MKVNKKIADEIIDYAHLLTKDYIINHPKVTIDDVRIINCLSWEIEKKYGIELENYYRTEWIIEMNKTLRQYA